MDSFAHLHLHTEFSMLDGAARVADVVAAAVADGQPAVAITDHGVMYGVVDFYRAATKAGVKPIIGIEAYVTPGSRFDRPARRDDVRYHMTLLAENQEGYRNLMALASSAYLDGFYYKPRMDYELLAEHSAGIIATSGCLGGPVAQRLAPDASREEGNVGGERDYEAAVGAAGQLQDIFGKDNFFIEVMDHGLGAQQRIMDDLISISGDVGAPLLATNDCHYTNASEAETHDVLLCIQTGATREDEGRFRFDADEFYMKSSAQMRTLFPNERYPAAADNTLWIAERADVRLDFGEFLLPSFQVPEGETELSYLRTLVYSGAKERYGDPLSDAVKDRIESELTVISDMGFPAYFLIVWDLMAYAKKRGIRTGPGRGSAPAAIVSYCLGITGIDPLEYGLIFERFLNPSRRQMPDIDIDFDERYRSEMIRYCAERYGSDHVAQIVTFSTIKGRQAVRDSARVLGLPYGLGDRIAKLMPPPILGIEASLTQCLEAPAPGADPAVRDFHANAAGLREAYQADPEVERVVDAARGLEGLRRQDSIHAAAVVISAQPLTDIVPVQRKGEDAEVVTQYEMGAIEALGLLKMDFLGLRNLSTIERTIELVARSRGETVDVDNIALDDPAVYEMLQRGESIGVFQLEGGPMRSLMRNLRPDRFADLIALVALYRPGPLGANMHNEYADRKNGRSEVSYLHPDLEPILGDSYGIMVFQEQVMQTAQAMAGFSMAEADDLRKAMGKKIPAVMAAQQDKFVAGCVANGHSEDLGSELFGFIEHFAGYGFNKPHSAAYGLVAYQTAWLKVHYPAEYMAALLTSVKRDKDRTALYLNECRTMGINVRPPDVNRSESDFTADEHGITFGLSAVRNIGEGVVELIELERTKNGPYEDFTDFVNRVDTSVLNRRTVESLIKAGAFDSVGHARRGLFESFEEMLDAVIARRRAEDMGQYSLFGSEEGAVQNGIVEFSNREWDRKVQLAFEKEMLGLYVSDHPLFGVSELLRSMSTTTLAGLWELPDGATVTVGGIVGSITRRYTRKGEPMQFFQFEDLEASVEVVCFPRTVNEHGPLIREDAVLLISGRLDHRGDAVKLVANEIREPTLDPDSTVRLRVPATSLSRAMVERLKMVLGNHPGSSPVMLFMTGESADKVIRLGDEFRVEARSALYAELRELLGPSAVV
ncbi:MAG: DNA polymerase III subunit alpha [Acidimicrobiia bacterium]